MNCPKCKGEMAEGTFSVSDVDMKVGWSQDKIVLGFLEAQENKSAIKSFKCLSCGYLESYAEQVRK